MSVHEEMVQCVIPNEINLIWCGYIECQNNKSSLVTQNNAIVDLNSVQWFTLVSLQQNLQWNIMFTTYYILEMIHWSTSFVFSVSVPAGLPFAILNIQHTPFKRGFFCSDDSIKYPFKDDTISYQLLMGIIIPFALLMVSVRLLS